MAKSVTANMKDYCDHYLVIIMRHIFLVIADISNCPFSYLVIKVDLS